MSNLSFEGMAIADNVVETIVNIAIQDVEGVACIAGSNTSGLFGLGKKRVAAKGVEVKVNEDDSISVSTRVIVNYGRSLPAVAQNIRESIADAVMTQIGITVSNVDVFVDGIQFA